MTVIDDRLALLETIHLDSGSHGSFKDGLCVMEAAAWIAGEPHSDRPACVSPVITSFLINWNDSLPDAATRDRLLRPLIPLAIGTRTTKRDEVTRAWMATDWLAREQAPAWLRLAGLTDHAVALETLVPLVGAASAHKAQPNLAAAWAAAWAAARAAARDALSPTVELLQASAVLLVKRMCEVGRQ